MSEELEIAEDFEEVCDECGKILTENEITENFGICDSCWKKSVIEAEEISRHPDHKGGWVI